MPRDGIDAEQAGSSPSALHSTVVVSEGGLACCQYSTPVQIRFCQRQLPKQI